MLRFEIKKFEDFSIQELYSVLNLRSQVFVVEQQSIYLDLDFKDQRALHVLGYSSDKLVAYARIFKSKDCYDLASIGRVVVAKEFRSYGYGHQLIDFSIAGIDEHFNEQNIHISAQLYLQQFYESHGFVAVGEEYLEDQIPHIAMELIKNK
ncbi:GNAT family N-acetyltransferase [Flavicella marina]|uniref:GNAT family N-acetyltransferase n=1 Tax=Flavicella marina TaxID=1475951 RepID=UPI001264C0EF|nr:GNAT family N-acetyltransferase [Flavicella marina]